MIDDLRPPFRQQFDNARDPYTARNTLGAVDAKYVTDAIAAIAVGGNVSNSGTPTVGQYAKWTDATHIQGVVPATVLTDIGGAPLASPTFTGDPKAPTPTAGDNDTSIATTAFVTGAIATATSASVVIDGGRLAYVSATALSFKPYNGDRIKINGAIYAIPSGGIAGLANTSVFVNGTGSSNLAASTVYWVFAFVNSGTVTADFRTAATHAASATAGNVGTEILTGNDTRTLIGLIRTNASSQFQDDAAFRGVISWFNRRNIYMAGASSSASTASTTSIEINAAARVFFLTWAEDHVSYGVNGYATGTLVGEIVVAGAGVDAAPLPYMATQMWAPAANSGSSLTVYGTSSLTEAFHTLSVWGHTNAGTATFLMTANGVIRG